MTDDLDNLVRELQAAFAAASGNHPSQDPHVLMKWRRVAAATREGISEKKTVSQLAIDLHHIYVGEGHRSEIMHLPETEPVFRGWTGVARFAIGWAALELRPFDERAVRSGTMSLAGHHAEPVRTEVENAASLSGLRLHRS